MIELFNKIIFNIYNCDHTLSIPTYDDIFILSCDASSYEVGSVLSVVCGYLDLPVTLYSRQLLPRKPRYSVTELEVLACYAQSSILHSTSLESRLQSLRTTRY